MQPVTFWLLGYPLHNYALLIAAGFIVGIWLSVRYGERQGYDRDMLLDLNWWILVSGLVGSRVLFIIVEWEQYYWPCVDWEHYNTLFPSQRITGPDCFRLLRFWTGGLVFLGGVIGAIGTIIWFMRRERLPVLPVTDVIIPSLAIGQFFGRLGCLMAGCCFGKPTDAAWGIEFPRKSMVWDAQVQEGIIDQTAAHAHAVHPTQLYDALGGLFLVVLLLYVRHHKRWHGQVFATWLLVYPIWRSTVEIFRGDAERGLLFEVVSEPLNAWLGLPAGSATFFSTSQFLSLLLAGAAGFLIWRQRRVQRAAPEVS